MPDLSSIPKLDDDFLRLLADAARAHVAPICDNTTLLALIAALRRARAAAASAPPRDSSMPSSDPEPPARCVALCDDGHLCWEDGITFDQRRGGVVCAAHAQAPTAGDLIDATDPKAPDHLIKSGEPLARRRAPPADWDGVRGDPFRDVRNAARAGIWPYMLAFAAGAIVIASAWLALEQWLAP